MNSSSRRVIGILALIGPGVLVAATGVGAGDLATGAFTGDRLGLSILWAVLVGAFLKFVLNEGLTRWQLATGDTLLEGCIKQFGMLFQMLFLLYLITWSFLVGLALMGACGVTLHAILPWQEASEDKVIYGIAQSLFAVILVRRGGFVFFEKLMSITIGIMFFTVMATVIALSPDLSQVFTGLFLPDLPSLLQGSTDQLKWTIGLMGGVGGTLTIVCYGYWIRELKRDGVEFLNTCRIDLGIGYGMTALFGLAMVIIGHHAGPFSAKGSGLLVELSETLGETLGPIARWCFLIGAWGAVFSSLLGVWQCVPYLFADFWQLSRNRKRTNSPLVVDCESFSYRGYLYGLGTIPAIGMIFMEFKQAQLIYAVVGALSIPLIALVLLLLCGRKSRIGTDYTNHPVTNLILTLILAFFTWAGVLAVTSKIPDKPSRGNDLKSPQQAATIFKDEDFSSPPNHPAQKG